MTNTLNMPPHERVKLLRKGEKGGAAHAAPPIPKGHSIVQEMQKRNYDSCWRP